MGNKGATAWEEYKKNSSGYGGNTSSTKAKGGASAWKEFRDSGALESAFSDRRNFISGAYSRVFDYGRKASSYYNSAQKDWNGLSWGNAAELASKNASAVDPLKTEGNDILAWLEENRDALGYNYTALKRQVLDINTGYDDILSDFNGAADFYGQFDTEADYFKWDSYSTVEKRQATYQQNLEKLDVLTKRRDELVEKAQPGNPYTTGGGPAATGMPFGGANMYLNPVAEPGPAKTRDSSAADTPYGAMLQYREEEQKTPEQLELEEIEREIASLQLDINNYKRGNTYDGIYYGSKVVDDYSPYLSDPSYGQYSASDFTNPQAGDIIANKEREDNPYTEGNVNRSGMPYVTGHLYSNPYEEPGPAKTRDSSASDTPFGAMIQYREPGAIDLGSDKKEEQEIWNQIADPLGMYLQTKPEERAILQDGGNNSPGPVAQLYRDGAYGNWDQLSVDETGIYYTILGTQGKDAAMKYLSDMTVELNRRGMKAQNTMYKQMFDEASGGKRAVLSALTVPANLMGGALGFVADTASTASGGEINPYSAAHGLSNYSEQVRQYQSAAFDESSSWELPWIGFSAGDLYQAAMSTADMIGGAIFGPKAYGILMGMGASTAEAKRLYEMGASSEQIAVGAGLAGAAEMVFEKYSMDKLIHPRSAGSLRKLFENALIQGGIEAQEEAATELANILTNNIVMTSESDWAKLLEKHNGNEMKAFIDAAARVGSAAAAGLVSGFLGGGFSSGADYTRRYRADVETGAVINDGNGREALINVATDLAKEQTGKAQREMNNLMDNVGKNRKFLSNLRNNRAVGKLYNAVRSEVANKNIQDIATVLQEKGFSEKKAKNIAEAFYNQATEQDVTKQQMLLIREYGKNPVVQKVIADTLFDTESPIYQRNLALREFEFDVMINQVRQQSAEQTGETGENTAEAVDDLDTTYEFSEDGKAHLKSAPDQAVDIVGFESINNGKVRLRTSDGQVVDATDVQYASEADAIVFETIANMGIKASSANKLLEGFRENQGADAEAYARGLLEAFEYGKQNRNTSGMSFSSALTPAQLDYVYRKGRKAAKKQTGREQARVIQTVERARAVIDQRGEAANAEYAVILEDGLTEEEMTPSQKASYEMIRHIPAAMKGNVRIYDGKTGEFGYYDPKSGDIYLNINATRSQKSMMAFTFGHELVHRAKDGSPAKYRKFADFLIEQYGKQSSDVVLMIAEQKEAAKQHNLELTDEQAFDEVVADACQRMLLDTNAGQRLAEFGAQGKQNQSIVQDVIQWIRDILEKLRSIFADVDPDSLAAQEFAKFDASVKQILADMYVDMTIDAGENLSVIKNAFGSDTQVNTNENGEFTMAQNQDGSQKIFNLATWENGGRETLEATLRREGYTQDEIDAALKIMDAKQEMVTKIANELDGNGRLAFPEQGRINEATLTTDIKDGHAVLSALVSNGDYPVNIDLLMVCKKRKAYQRVINRLCETGMIKQATVDALAIAEINKILGKYGFETACLGCFVESRRLRIQEWAQTIVKEWNGEVNKRDHNAKPFGFGKGEAKLTPDEVMQLIGELETSGPKNDKGNLNLGQGSAVKRMGVLLDKVPSLRRTLAVEDLITPEGLSSLRQFDSNLFSMVKSRYGSNSPKFVQEFNPYNHELAKYGKVPSQYKNLREYLYAIGGARMQSFSDFIVENWFDYCQIVADLAARKLPMHTYTKEIAMVKLFGMTGIKINMSLIPDVDRSLGKEYAGLTRNAQGELELIWADKDRNKATGGQSYMQSINAREAFELQNDPRYSANIGTIAIGISDRQIRMMLNDSRIRMVIPYHASGMNPVFADMMGTSFYKNYTDFQNTTVKQMYDSKGRPVSVKLTKPQVAQLTGGFQFNEVLQEKGDARAAADAYKAWCSDSSLHTITIKGETYTAELTPKFNDFADEANYYKLLEDFNTYDCITEQAAPQGDVQQIYPEGFEDILRAELSGQERYRQKQEKNQAFDKAMEEIESYLSKHTKADTVYYAQQQNIKLSKKDSKLDAADRAKLQQLQEQGVSFKLPVNEDTSPRALLSNALDSVITDPVEKQKLQEYRENIEKMNEQEAKLRDLKSQIKDLSFATGPRDTQKIKALREEAAKTENRINLYDKILLRFEASSTLQKVLQRERDNVRTRERAKTREAVEAMRQSEQEKYQQRIDAIKDRHKATKAKMTETRAKREATTKLRDLVLDTVRWIERPKKTEIKVPDVLKKPYKEFLNGIDLSSRRLEAGGNPTVNDLMLATAMGSLATAIDRITAGQDPSSTEISALDYGYLDLPADFVQRLQDMAETVKTMMDPGDYVINSMTAKEVRELSKMIRTLNHAIREIGNLYANTRFANAQDLGKESMGFMDDLGEVEHTRGSSDFIIWDNALPFYAFKRFGLGGEAIFEGLMDGQDKLAFLSEDIFDFQKKTWTGEEARKWSEDTHTIQLPSGNSLTLTTADAMSIYCLSRRGQGLQHLLGGGVRVIGIQKGSKKAKDSRANLTMEDIDAIVDSLDSRQKKVAEDIQEFMSTTCAEWGNEISMKRFLTREFTEEHYFPIESNRENMTTQDPTAQQSDLFRLLNISATKALTPNANNEVIIRNVFDVFIGHASDMARLNAYAMPLLDYMKWLNYRERTVSDSGQVDVKGVRKSMEKAYGAAAQRYVMNLIKDVNGRYSDAGDPTALMKWMRAAKTAAVGNSLRVATLQVTSYPRAAMVIAPKNLALGLSKKPNIKDAKKYCGIALWKSFGFYDTNISRSIEDQMKGIENPKQKMIEWSLKGAEIGDALTWGYLWNACEYEVAATHQYQVGSEEFKNAVGKKLREVIYRTQVVDSTLTRSDIMRKKSGAAQEAAAFMSEATLSANILMDAGFAFNLERRRTGSAKAAWGKTGAYIMGAIAVYSISQLTAALVEALWDAWRDDDDEEFGEKYLAAFRENLILDILPFNKVPIVSDIFEAVLSMAGIGFYSSDRMTTTWITNAVSAVDAWKDYLGGKSNVTAYGAIFKSVKTLSSYYGVAGSGLMREAVALWNNTAGAYDSTLKIRQRTLSKSQLGGEYLDAVIAGNDRQAESIAGQFATDEEREKAIRAAIKSRFTSGEIGELDAAKYLILYGGLDASDAHWNIEKWVFDMSNESEEEYHKYDEFLDAVKSGENLDAVIEEYLQNGVSRTDLRKQISSGIRPEYIDSTAEEREKMRENLLAAMQACGMLESDAENTIGEWEFEAEYGFDYSNRKTAYLSGEVDEDLLKKALVEYGGYDPKDAELQIQAYDWEAEGYEGVTIAAVRNYNEYCAASNVPKDIYMDIRKFANSTENDVVNGEKIPYSAVKKIMQEINSQTGLTSAQKTAIARSIGWKDSTIQKYKLW